MYFSVRKPIKIGNYTYIPGICYKAEKPLIMTIEKLQKDGVTDTYTEKVLFCNGAPFKVKKSTKAVKSSKTVKK